MAAKTTTTGPDTSAWASIGRNVKTHLDKDSGVLFIAVQTGKSAYANIAPTGKGNVVIGTTQGNQKIDGAVGGLSLGLNIYGPPPVG